MGRRVDVDQLIDSQEVARIIGLAFHQGVSLYQARYPDMPRPLIDLGPKRSKLWLRQDIEKWARARRSQ
jgi:glutathione-regulated potassium-efflux system ancillary protein KefG